MYDFMRHKSYPCQLRIILRIMRLVINTRNLPQQLITGASKYYMTIEELLKCAVQTNSISVSYRSTLHSFTFRKVFIGFSNYCLRLRSTVVRFVYRILIHCYIRYTVSICVHTIVFVHTTNIWADLTCRSPCTHWV